MLRAREKLLLALVDALGGAAGNIDYQKLLFVFCQETGAGAPYDFVPYRFGGFSFTSYADRRRLAERGYLEKNAELWKLTPRGRLAVRASQRLRKDLTAFVGQWANLRGDRLIAETYRRFPYYAIRSEVAEKLLRKEPESLAAIAAARPKPAGARLFTIGYEGRSLEDCLNRLIGAGVALLCDVRRNALSRKYGFSKTTLKTACEGAGLQYEHLPELGIASVERQGLDGPSAYERLFEIYRTGTLPRQGEALATIRRWIDDGQAVALMCFEAQAHQCHRHCVAAELELRFGKPFAAIHL